ncbi:MAG: hypothetical protein JO257_20620 [Deltaproteobacteria bacterium]|nr:hypothetical protein [Deltaproteobacteria bacterium]
MRAAVVAATVLAGCYSPHPQSGTPCPSGACPDPLVCSPATHTCERSASEIDAPRPPDDGPLVDAMPDAAHSPDAPAPTAQLVQQAVNHADADTLTITLPAAPTAGDVLVFVGGDVHSELDAATGVTGGGVTTWNRATFSAINANVEIWYGVTNGTARDIVLHGVTGDTHPIFGNVSEWSGLLTSNLVDAAHAAHALVSPADPGAITTTYAHDLVVLGVNDFGPNTYGTPAPGTWTALTAINADITLAGWYRIVTPSTIDPSVSETDHEWDAAIAAFRVAP